MKKLTDWHKKQIKNFQERWGVSEYQALWLSFAKGFVIGAILL